jgi:formyl-CoA transferase/CoA:oxalate CoA-transferase
VIEALLAKADALVENFRPGTLDKMGLGYTAVSARRPDLVYVSISGFGQNGPRRDEAGYDAVAQAEGGLMSVTGTADGPAVRVGVAIADIASGMFAFQGLLLALLAKARTGRGQHVDVGMLDVVAALMSYQAGRYLVTGDSPPRSGNRHLTIAPYDTFDTSDGVLVLAVGNDRQWQTLCATFGLAALGAAEAFRTNEGRVVNYAALRRELEPFFRARALEDLVAALRGAGVPCGAVRSVAEVMNDPQILARAMVESVAHPTIGPLSVLGVPVKLSDTPGAVRTPPPRLGEHTRAVLSGDLGLSAAEIDRLMASRAVR